MQSDLTTAAVQVLAGLPESWQKRRLDEVCTVVDCPHTTPALSESGPYVVRSQDIRTGVVRLETTAHVSEETYRERVRRSTPEYGDILYSREGTYFGIAAEVPPGTRLCLGQRMVQLRPDKRTLTPRYLKYWLNSPAMSSFIAGLRDGSVAERLNMATIRGLPVPIPPLPLQMQVAELLGGIDDRIELLRQTNVTLESIARVLFKSWFIDFEPVRAKAEGYEPEGMDAAAAALFPAEFEESRLGLIPKGWQPGTLDSICTNSRVQAKPGQMSSDTTYIGLEHMPRRSIALDSAGTAEGLASGKFWFERNDVLFGKLRPYFHKVGLAPCRGVCSTDILVLRPKAAEWLGFLVMHASSDALVSHTTQLSNGARMPRTSWHDVGGYDVVLPMENIAAAFNVMVGPMFERIHANIEAARVLAELRETLLPRLIAGKLRVPEAQVQAEEAIA